MMGLGSINDFLFGAILLALVIAFGITGWKAVNQGVFRAVSASYYGRKAQGLGGICLLAAVVAGFYFLQGLLSLRIFFILGGALGAYLTLRYYKRAI